MEVLPDAAMWSVIIGFLSPLIIAVIQQPKWSKPARAITTFLWSVVAGGGTAYFTSAFTGLGISSSILLVLVTAISTYKGLWSETGVTSKIESKTSVSNTDTP